MEWDLLQAIYHARPAAQRAYLTTPPPIAQFTEEFAVDGRLVGQFLYMMENYNPNALSAAHYMRRNCYEHPKALDELIASFAAAGLLEADGEDTLNPAHAALYGQPTVTRYRATEKGFAVYRRFWELFGPRWSIPPVESAELTRALELLAKVNEAIKNAPTPPEHWSVDTRALYGVKPASDVPLLHMNTLIFDLWAYRDDVHLAAWQGMHKITPNLWETFTYLWRGEANVPEKFPEVIDRGFSADDFRAAFDELVALGWAVKQGDEYAVTDSASAMRQQVEDLTNEWFYAPWSALSDAERTELRTSLECVRDHLVMMAQPKETQS